MVDMTRRGVLGAGGIGFFGMATQVLPTKAGLLLPSEHLITQEARPVTMMSQGYIRNYSLTHDVTHDYHGMMGSSISMSLPAPRVVNTITDLDIDVEMMDHTLISEAAYRNSPVKVVFFA